jgi:Polyketide cyclase / dehydrase and lipid transport
MGRWTAHTRVARPPDEVLSVLTEPEAIARWSPVDFQLLDFDGERLLPGDRVHVRGLLVGLPLEFEVVVREADAGRLALTATGPIRLDVEYLATPGEDGSDIHASVAVSGQGLCGRVLAQATDTLLAAGALRAAIERIAQELELALV